MFHVNYTSMKLEKLNEKNNARKKWKIAVNYTFT